MSFSQFKGALDDISIDSSLEWSKVDSLPLETVRTNFGSIVVWSIDISIIGLEI